METVPKDVVELITNKLSAKDFLNYCASETGKQFCSNKGIWSRRIQKDFGFLLQGRNNKYLLVGRETDPRQAYLDLFTNTSKTAENLVEEILGGLGQHFAKFLKDEYREELYMVFFNFLLKMLNEIKPKSDNDVAAYALDYFWDHRQWRTLLPYLYQEARIGNRIWSDEIGGLVMSYATEVFRSAKFSPKPVRTRKALGTPELPRIPIGSPRGSPELPRLPVIPRYLRSPELPRLPVGSPPRSPRF